MAHRRTDAVGANVEALETSVVLQANGECLPPFVTHLIEPPAQDTPLQSGYLMSDSMLHRFTQHLFCHGLCARSLLALNPHVETRESALLLL